MRTTHTKGRTKGLLVDCVARFSLVGLVATLSACSVLENDAPLDFVPITLDAAPPSSNDADALELDTAESSEDACPADSSDTEVANCTQ